MCIRDRAQLAQALQAKIPIKGYFYWSLLDNFEWAEGYGPRFGLLDAERRLRPSAKLYQSLIQAAQAEPLLTSLNQALASSLKR